MSVQVTSASEASSHSGVETPLRSSGIARRVPPRRTVSIAAWHTCQFPVPSSPTAPFTGFTVRPHASYKSDRNKAGLWFSGTAEMKDISPARPKNLATNTVAWPWDSALSIHCKHGRRIHDSLHPFRSTRHPLQLISRFNSPAHEPPSDSRRCPPQDQPRTGRLLLQQGRRKKEEGREE